MGGLVLRVLGLLEVHRAGTALPLTSGRQRAVLAALLVAAGRPVSADELVAAAWGEHRLPDNPRAALHTVLSRLRTALGEETIRAGPAGYRLDVARDDVDARRFEALRERAATAPPAVAAQLLTEALALWHGPAYAEFAGTEFARAEAVRLNELRADSVEDYAELSLALGRPAAAISLLEALLVIEPWRGRATALLMRALHTTGRSADALDRYRAYREGLVRELGLDPPSALAELQRRILAGELPVETGRPAPEPPRWLARSTAFLGRDDALAALYGAVRANRLVTVTGVGGVGKTRLVAEALPELVGRLAAPVSVVELAGVHRGGVEAAVAAALGLDAQAAPAREAVLQYLGVGSVLLVVDNCEHVRAEVRDLVDAVLRGCPGVRLVATSRHPLHVPDEQVLPLDPLPTTAAEDGGPAAASRLLLDRLRRRQPRFPVTADTLPLLAEVCRQVDGVPLAIELAANQAAVLGLRPLVERLGGGLDTLAGGDGAGMRSVLDRSYALLDPAGQRLFATLSVFAADFDLTAAEHVAEQTPAEPVPIRLARLVDASLVTVTHRHDAARYRLLGIVRAFAAHRLEDRDDAHAARAAHARWVRSLAVAAASGCLAADAGAHYERLEQCRADVFAAIRWALEVADLDLAGGITAALRLFPHWTPDAEVLGLVREVADDPRVRRTPVAASAVAAGAMAAVDVGDLGHAHRLGTEALALATEPDEHYLALVALAVAALYRGQHDESGRRWRQLLDVPGLSPARRIDGYASLALLGCYTGDLDAARRHAGHLQDTARAAAGTGYHAFATYAVGEVRLLDDPVGAVPLLDLAAAQAEATRAGQIAAVARIAQVSGLVRLGRHAQACTVYPALLQQLRRRGSWPQLWTALRILAELLYALDHAELAGLLLAAAETDPTAPVVSGDDIKRYRELQHQISERIGADAAARITTTARSLTRAQVLDRAVSGLAATV